MDIIYDVILKRHGHDTRPDVCVFYDDDREVTIKKMAEYDRKNGFTVSDKDGKFSIATIILRERTSTGKVISETPYHKIFNTVTGKRLTQTEIMRRNDEDER